MNHIRHCLFQHKTNLQAAKVIHSEIQSEVPYWPILHQPRMVLVFVMRCKKGWRYKSHKFETFHKKWQY